MRKIHPDDKRNTNSNDAPTFLQENMWLKFWLVILTLFIFCDGLVRPIRRFKHRSLTDGMTSPNITYDVKLFTQRLDHFQPTDNRTWSQRYGEVLEFYKPGGPVFLIIGWEREEKFEEMCYNVWCEYAKKYNALMFDVEHRYYGQSRPASDLSTENLKYLSSEQALADLAYFIAAMNKQHRLPADTKWVAFGGSYAGNLAAWLRYKYPHLVHASVASSAPVFAKLDFSEYNDVVRQSITTFSSECSEAIETAFETILKELDSPNGRKRLEKLFRLCTTIDPNNKNDVTTLLIKLSGNTTRSVQAGTIKKICNTMLNESKGTPVERYAKLRFPVKCLDFRYESALKELNNTTKWDSNRQWTYQTCSEFGYFQTSKSRNSLFGKSIPLKYFNDQCRDVFGKGFTAESMQQAIDWTNTMYGGLDGKATRVVYVHGSLDPWHASGITTTRIPEAPVIYINGSTHCWDMIYPAPTPAVKSAQEQISVLLGKWLTE